MHLLSLTQTNYFNDLCIHIFIKGSIFLCVIGWLCIIPLRVWDFFSSFELLLPVLIILVCQHRPKKGKGVGDQDESSCGPNCCFPLLLFSKL